MPAEAEPRRDKPAEFHGHDHLDRAIHLKMSPAPASTPTRQIMPASRVVHMALLCFSGALLLSPDVRAASWKPFPPEELAGTVAPLEPDAAAEVLYRKTEIDDSDYPRWRTITEYTRYKIFDPERADNIIRLSEFTAAVRGDDVRMVDMSARLTLPDGTTKEFGAESVHEQNVIRESVPVTFFTPYAERVEVKQKFLVVGGAQPGSILEFKVRTVERAPLPRVFRPLQIPDVPIRRLEYIHQLGQSPFFQTSFFAINSTNIEIKEDKDRTVTLTGHDLPSLHNEPFSGVPSYYSATAVTCYDANTFIPVKGINLSRHFTPEMGPWAPYATIGNWISRTHIEITKDIKKVAAEVTQGATSDLEKARRIHDYVQNLNQKFLHQGKKTHEAVFGTIDDSIVSMYDVLHFEERDPPPLKSSDFLWLEISLDRAAGLHTESLLLPNRIVAPFDPRLPSSAFLPGTCAAIEIDGQWHFSMPQLRTSIPFDQLPWWLESQQGLLALDSKQEFIDVPASPPEQSVTKNEGAFTLGADGTLTGQCKRTLTGQYAYDARVLLNRKKEPNDIMKRILGRELDPAEIEITGIDNLDDYGKPLEISYTLTWAGFATIADNRIFFHPFVFRTKALSPFTATERYYPILFPFEYQDNDHLTIAFPPGYDPEVKVEPASHPGKILSHMLKLAYDAEHHVLYVDRDFSSALIALEPSNYAKLKGWYDAVANSDQHQLILIKKATAVAASPAAP
jgi:hypothetical protein